METGNHVETMMADLDPMGRGMAFRAKHQKYDNASKLISEKTLWGPLHSTLDGCNLLARYIT
jgi:hypothetical protein